DLLQFLQARILPPQHLGQRVDARHQIARAPGQPLLLEILVELVAIDGQIERAVDVDDARLIGERDLIPVLVHFLNADDAGLREGGGGEQREGREQSLHASPSAAMKASTMSASLAVVVTSRATTARPLVEKPAVPGVSTGSTPSARWSAVKFAAK